MRLAFNSDKVVGESSAFISDTSKDDAQDHRISPSRNSPMFKPTTLPPHVCQSHSSVKKKRYGVGAGVGKVSLLGKDTHAWFFEVVSISWGYPVMATHLLNPQGGLEFAIQMSVHLVLTVGNSSEW